MVGRVVVSEHLPTRYPVSIGQLQPLCGLRGSKPSSNASSISTLDVAHCGWRKTYCPHKETRDPAQQQYCHHVWHNRIPLPSFHSLFHHSNSASIVLVLMVDLVQTIQVNQEPMNCWQLARSESTTNLRRSLSLLHGLAPIGWECLLNISIERIPITFHTECGHVNVWVGQGKQHDSSLLVKIMGKCFNQAAEAWLLNLKQGLTSWLWCESVPFDASTQYHLMCWLKIDGEASRIGVVSTSSGAKFSSGERNDFRFVYCQVKNTSCEMSRRSQK